jgi:GNAT superfamily N-acetyltransferase
MSVTNLSSGVRALVDALRHDPFYDAITAGHADNEAARRQTLARYFDYAIREGSQQGRVVVWPEREAGAAIWSLPQAQSTSAAQKHAKAEFLAATLGERGMSNYRRILDFMLPRAAATVSGSAWYLSILGVSPAAQGHGIGRRLLEPTLVEADRAGVDCYLETYDGRNPSFYQRLGFNQRATCLEPVTGAAYAIMVRSPKPPDA